MARQSTKDILGSAVGAAGSALTAKNSTAMDAKKAAKGKAVTEAAGKTETIKAEVAGEKLLKLKSEIAGAFDTLTGLITTKLGDIEALDTLITSKTEALQDLYGIEAKADSIAVLVNANEDLKVKYEQEILDLRAQLADMKQAHYDSIDDYDAEVADRRKKEQDEYKYNFERSKKMDKDAWDDEKRARERVLTEREKEVEIRESDVDAQEDDIADLKAQVDSIPTFVSAAEGKGYDKAKAECGKTYGIETAALKREFEADKKVLQAQLDNAVDANTAKDRTIADLQAKLDAAYAKITEVANNASGAAGKAETIAALQKAISDKSSLK